LKSWKFRQSAAGKTRIPTKRSWPECGSELKRFAAKHGVDLATASLEELAELEKILRDKIVELLKGSLALPKDESQAAATNAADAKAASLNEAQFRMKSLQDVLGSVKTVSRETGLSAYTDLSRHSPIALFPCVHSRGRVSGNPIRMND
jgi:hypothetical protein